MAAQDQISELLSQAWRMRGQGDYNSARELTGEAEAACDPDDHLHLGRVYHLYMQFEHDGQRLNEALAYSQKSVAHYRQSKSPTHLAHAKRHLADLRVALGELQLAIEDYEEVIRLYEGSDQTRVGDLANAYRGYSLALEAEQRSEDAHKAWQHTRSLYETCQIQAGIDEAEDHILGFCRKSDL